MNMKGAFDRTKVVVRNLPPAISIATLMEQIDGSFSGRYHWVSFHPGKTSVRNQTFSRAYIDFKRPEDVLEFAEFFNGHMFVNEKGAQFKTIVEYAPSQRVPKNWSSKDGREGTISDDPEYMGFLEVLAKPVVNLPSAEVQLERREAERSGMSKVSPIVTPLMDFVRQKRALGAKYGKSIANGKLGRRSGRSPSSASKRGSVKKTISTVYVSRDSSRSTGGKDKPTFVIVSKCDELQLSGKTITAVADTLMDVEISGGAKKKVLLLKSKEKEASQGSERISVNHICGSAVSSSSSQREGVARTIRRMSSSKGNQNPLSGDKTKQQMQAPSLEGKCQGKRPPRPPRETNGSANGRSRGSNSDGYRGGKFEKHTRLRYKDRSGPGNNGDLSDSRNGDAETLGSGHGRDYPLANGFRILSRGGTAENVKHSGNPSFSNDEKHAKRGTASGHGAQEKQVWVQKS